MNERAPGFTLVESLIVAVVAAVLFAAIFQALVAQQRGYREQKAIVELHHTAGASIEALAMELRQVSATGGDLIVATEDSVTFRAYRKAGIVCESRPDEDRLVIWELDKAFAPGDSVVVFLDHDGSTATDDAWWFGVVQDTVSGACSDPWDWLSDDRSSTVLLTGGGRIHGIGRGAPVRAFEHVTYGRFEVDGARVVGRRVAGSNALNHVGPSAPTHVEGFRLRYFDGEGRLLRPSDASTRARVARIEVSVRDVDSDRGGSVGVESVDAFAIQVALRGNVWR